MKKIIIGLFLAFGISGCALFNATSDLQVSPQAVYIAANSFNVAEITATNYLRLPKCKSTSNVFCRSPVATARIIPAIRSGRMARDELEIFIQNNPGKFGPSGTYNILIAANNTLQYVFQQYNIGTQR